MSVTSSVDQAARHLLGSRNHAENADDVSAVSDAKAPGPCRHAILGQSHYAEADKMRLDGTLAELVDNAGDAGATRVDIDCDDAKIIVADNGCGCDAAGIGALGGHRTSTRTDASERFTGKFGQAFTRAVLSLGDTCTVISYQGLVFHVGLLSKKLQIESNTRECLLPVASFRYPSGYEDVVVEVVEDDDGQLWNKGSLIFERLIKPPPPRPRKRQTPAEKSVAKRVQQAMDLLQTGAMQFADVHGTGASVTFTERDGTFEVEIKRGDDDDATQD